MNTTKWLLMATAFAFLSSVAVVAAQHEPLPPAPAEKMAPRLDHGLDTPASPRVTGGAVTDEAAKVDRKNTEVGEGNRTGELQENQGRSDTTGQAPSRELNRVPNEKNSGAIK
jgi:hypothetical protein